MGGPEILDLARQTIYVLLAVSAPMMIVALVVGLAIALLQALTQVQEMTLTFVPKIGAILLVAVISAPFIYQGLSHFTFSLYDRIATGF